MAHRKQINAFLENNPSLDHSRYYRIVALGCMDAFITLPVGIFTMWQNTSLLEGDLWPGWAEVHEQISLVSSTSASYLRSHPEIKRGVIFNQWISVVCAIVFFLFFGVTADARAQYRRWFCVMATCFGFRSTGKGKAEVHPNIGPFRASPGALS